MGSGGYYPKLPVVIRLLHSPVSHGNVSSLQAYLEKAEFKGADFRGSILKKSNIRNANFINAKSLTPEQVLSACYWEEAVYKSNPKDNKKYIQELQNNKSLDRISKSDCDQYWTEKRTNKDRLEGVPGAK